MGATSVMGMLASVGMFQSTPPRWGRQGDRRELGSGRIVSIHAPAMGAASYRIRRFRAFGGFNPRPRDGGDTATAADNEADIVSIHAPAMGATNRYGTEMREADVSIHAPAMGATFRHKLTALSRTSFNPRPRDGSDGVAVRELHLRGGFNPRPRDGGDHHRHALGIEQLVSIHAPAMGATWI